MHKRIRPEKNVCLEIRRQEKHHNEHVLSA